MCTPGTPINDLKCSSQSSNTPISLAYSPPIRHSSTLGAMFRNKGFKALEIDAPSPSFNSLDLLDRDQVSVIVPIGFIVLGVIRVPLFTELLFRLGWGLRASF